MTDDQFDQAEALQQQIENSVREIVDKMTEGIDSEMDNFIRMRMTETFRFWRY